MQGVRCLKSQVQGVLEHLRIHLDITYSASSQVSKSQIQGVLKHPTIQPDTSRPRIKVSWSIPGPRLLMDIQNTMQGARCFKSQVQSVLEHPRILKDIPYSASSWVSQIPGPGLSWSILVFSTIHPETLSPRSRVS